MKYNPSVELNYFFFDKLNLSAFFYEIVGRGFTILDSTFQNTEIRFGQVTYTKVPEPTTMGCNHCIRPKKPE